ncbi:MAG: protein kinase [Parachlamydiaceae bacterium]|nr:protein kinase [Parachlamydiaceae bacterium]
MESAAEQIPKQIGPYKIEALLEKGGMSHLYLATHPDTREPITIKALFPEFASNPEMVQRFLREAEIIGLADHPNIVKLYGQGQWEGGLYIAMEFIQGISLRQYLLRNLISLKYALEIVMEIAMALCHLHAHGVIHRDLKPENILITESGGVKVIDFGISQLLTEEIANNSIHKRRLIGTPIYMSPEQRENPESTSYPSDIYSLGIIAYELVLGKLSHGQIHLSIMPKGIQKILTKALQPKIEDRYQDIVDFMMDLSAYINSPALLKENKEVAPLSDLSESLRKAQHSLVPQEPPNWSETEIGFGSYRSLGISSLYYDFFDLAHGAYGIIIGDPSIKGSPGIVYTSVLRGMVRSLSQLTKKPEEMATVLNALLLDDPMKQKFAFSYLIIEPKSNLFRFISCGLGQLWHIPKMSHQIKQIQSNYPPLGSDSQVQFKEVTSAWHIGDTLLLEATISTNPEEVHSAEELFRTWLEESGQLSPQKQVDDILRKAKINLSRKAEDRSFFVLSCLRKQ